MRLISSALALGYRMIISGKWDLFNRKERKFIRCFANGISCPTNIYYELGLRQGPVSTNVTVTQAPFMKIFLCDRKGPED